MTSGLHLLYDKYDFCGALHVKHIQCTTEVKNVASDE